MKILLFGKNGQIGKSLYKILKNKHNILALGRKECDFTIEGEISKIFNNLNIDLVINAAAYTDVDLAEKNSDEAYLINSNSLKVISAITKKIGIPIISYSTDYVFDGNSKNKYNEESKPNPINLYGKTKLLGEENLKTNDKYIIIRTSRVFSNSGNNFINKILTLAKKNNELKIVNDQIATPTSSDYISKITSKLIDYMEKNDNKIKYGIYHITARGSCSWHDYAKFIIEVALKNGHDLKVDLDRIYAIPSVNFKSNASRPKNSVLSTKKIESLLSIEVPKWEKDVITTIEKIIKNR